MSALVEILVPEGSRIAVPSNLSRLQGVSVRSSPSSRTSARRIVLASINVIRSQVLMHRLQTILKTVSRLRQTRHLALVLRNREPARSSDLSFTAFRLLADLHERWFRRGDSMLYLVPDDGAMRRLVNARRMGAEDKLIASASVLGRDLIVWSCEPRMYRVGADEIPALSALSDARLSRFALSESGSRLHWDEGDVDLNLDSIRELVDDEFRAENQRRARGDATRFAKAIRVLREAQGLRQSDISGLSEREVRRLETGRTMPHTESLEKLAASHGMTVAAYVDALAWHTSRSRKRSTRSSVPSD